MSLQLGEIESKYEILEKLGEGGMGAVFKARHRLLDEVRVIKAILPLHQGDMDLQQRFRREAQAATRLRHPNIAQVHDLLIDDEGTTHIVMEFIEGRTLQQALTANGTPDLTTAVEIASQALEAVGYLHGQGYMHRDIAPDNLMLSRGFDGKVLVKLIDLGLAKQHAASAGLTAPGVFMGKVRYAAPEQFADPERQFDPRSDLYSFGVVLYELLTGQCPIRGETFAQMIASHLNHPVPDFEETDPGGKVPDELREVTLKTLAKEPSERVPSAEILLDALDPYREKSSGKSQYIEDLLANVMEAKRPPTSVSAAASDSAVSSTQSMDWEPSNRRSGSGSASRESAVAASGSGLSASTMDTLVGVRQTPATGVASEAVVAEAAEEQRPSRTAMVAWTLAAVAVIGLALAGISWRRPTAPVAVDGPGSLRLDAVPWAEVREIKKRDGEAQPLGGSVYTPVMLSLDPGWYEISLAHPDFDEPRSIEIEVSATESASRKIEFEPRAVETYFETVGLATQLQEAGL